MPTNLSNAPVVIPGAQTQLAQGVQLNTGLLTAQTLFTAPPGMFAVVTAVVLRKASTVLTGTTSLSVSSGATSTSSTTTTADIITASTAAATLAAAAPANSGAESVNPYVIIAPNVATPHIVETGSVATLTFAAAAAAPGTVECDVLGYLTSL